MKDCRVNYPNGRRPYNTPQQFWGQLRKPVFDDDNDDADSVENKPSKSISFQRGYEFELHNGMHATYVGGAGCYFIDEGEYQIRPSMAWSSNAAYDPIFYSFHSYIDFALDAWIGWHGADLIDKEIKQVILKASQPSDYGLGILSDEYKGNMGPVELYLDSRTLGYTYDLPLLEKKTELLAELQAKKMDSRFLKRRSQDWKISTVGSSFRPVSKPNEVVTQNFILNKESLIGYSSILVGPEHTDKSYQVDVYLHPKGVVPDISKTKFRKKHLAGLGFYWNTNNHEGHDHGVVKVQIDLADEVNALAKNPKYFNEEFTITTNITYYN